MKTFKFIMSLCTALLLSTLFSVGIAPVLNIPAWPVFGITTLVAFIPMQHGVLFMAVQKEIWLNDVVGNLFKVNPHLSHAMNADQFVLAGKVVHIPNAGNKPGVQKNRAKLPATILKRNEIDITFPLDEYTSDPFVIPNADKYELSYDERNSVIQEQKAAISELVGDWFYRYWAPVLAAAMRRTSGSTTVTAHYGTGTRKAITIDDVKYLQKIMNNWGVPSEGRFASLDAEMYDQFTSLLSATQYRDFSAAYNVAEGIVGRLFGFTFLESRPTVLRYDVSGTPVPYDPEAAIVATDNGAGLFWQESLVIRAMGQHELFESIGEPTYYGDVYSALLRAGGRIKRNDAKGVCALVQIVN
jgi:hypothetical protein